MAHVVADFHIAMGNVICTTKRKADKWSGFCLGTYLHCGAPNMFVFVLQRVHRLPYMGPYISVGVQCSAFGIGHHFSFKAWWL